MIHQHEYGETIYDFHFIPTEDKPHPDVTLIAPKLLTANFDPTDAESITLIQLDAKWPLFRADEYGSAVVNVALGDYDPEIIIDGS
jgi:hypothetical protein